MRTSDLKVKKSHAYIYLLTIVERDVIPSIKGF